MHDLLRDLDTALTDWVRQYAPEECTDEHVQESARRRCSAGGTLAYIADLKVRIAKALEAPSLREAEKRAATAQAELNRAVWKGEKG